MSTILLSLASVVLVSLVSLVGIFTVSLREAQLRWLSSTLVSFAVGTLLGDAFIHLIPSTFEEHPETTLRSSLLILSGMLLFFVVEKLLRHKGPSKSALATINLAGDTIHNFIDGALIAASYLYSPTLGLSTTIAVLFHELPQELGDFGILLKSGLRPQRAILLNLVSASASIVGALIVLWVGASVGVKVVSALLPITAGGFVYLAAADLIPELQSDSRPRALFVQVGMIALGIGVMSLLSALE